MTLFCRIHQSLLAWLDRCGADAPPRLARRHIDRCAPCRRFRHQLATLDGRLGAPVTSPLTPDGDDAESVRRIMRVIERERRAAPVRGLEAKAGGRWRVAAGLGAGAAIAVLAVVTALSTSEPAPQEPGLASGPLQEIPGTSDSPFRPALDVPALAELAARQMDRELVDLRRDAAMFLERVERYWPVPDEPSEEI